MPQRLAAVRVMPSPQSAGHDAGEVRLARLKRNDVTELRVSICEFKGRRFVSLREWFKGTREGGDGRWLPGKRGLSVKLGELDDVANALREAAVQLQAARG